MKSSSGQPPRTNHTTVSRCRHCDGEVVTLNRLVFISHLLPMSKIGAFLRAVYTVRDIDDDKLWLCVTLKSTPLPYHIRKVTQC